jgi:hypothetical protein
LRGAVATKQSQSEIATPFGLAMTTFCDSECKLFHALGNNLKEYQKDKLQNEMTNPCGRVTRRSAKDEFVTWDFYMQGHSPMEIARKLFPSFPKSVALERVRRRLARCQTIIYGSESTDKKMLMLTSFDPWEHLKSCEECKVAKESDDYCRLMQSYLSQECHYQRERQIPRQPFKDKEIELSDHFSEDDMIEKIDRNDREETIG